MSISAGVEGDPPSNLDFLCCSGVKAGLLSLPFPLEMLKSDNLSPYVVPAFHVKQIQPPLGAGKGFPDGQRLWQSRAPLH